MFSPDSHRDKLTALKGKVNRMGQEINRLRAERESLAPWEQQAVDEVLRLLQATSENTESAIEYFNEHKDRLWMETYRDYADHIWQDSDQIERILKRYLKYDRLLDQEVHVEERIRADSQRNAERVLTRRARKNFKSLVVEIDDGENGFEEQRVPNPPEDENLELGSGPFSL